MISLTNPVLEPLKRRNSNIKTIHVKRKKRNQPLSTITWTTSGFFGQLTKTPITAP